MIIIALLSHINECLIRYHSRRQLSRMPYYLRKDLGLMQNAYEPEIAKGNLYTLIKEISSFKKEKAELRIKPTKTNV